MAHENLEASVRAAIKGEAVSINEHVRIGEGSAIWHHCVLIGTEEKPIIIGDNTQIGSSTEIRQGARIGNSCKIQKGCFIGDDTVMGDFVFMGPYTGIMVDRFPSVRKILDKSYKVEPVTIRDHAVFRFRATIGSSVTIGRCSLVEMNAVVTENVPDYAVVDGNPARVIGNIREMEPYKTGYPEFKEL